MISIDNIQNICIPEVPDGSFIARVEASARKAIWQGETHKMHGLR